MILGNIYRKKFRQKLFSLVTVFAIFANTFVGLLPILTTEVSADSFYPSNDALNCNFAMATSVSYRSLPSNSTSAGGMSYNSGQVYGASGNYPETHRITDVADITFPDAHRYRGTADRVAVPPNTRIDVGFYVHNYSGHTITAHNGHLFVSRANTDLGDWGRLGAGGSYANVNHIYAGENRTRSGRRIQTGNIGTYPANPISNPPLGRTIYSFTTIQPMQIQSRTASPEFLGGGNLRIRYDLTVRNTSQYNLSNIRIIDDLPSGETFDQTENFNSGQTRTFTYYANMGSSYSTNITNSPARVQDPNRHKEEAAIASNSLLSSNPESRTLIVDRDDAGAPSGWTGRQPDFSAYPNGDYFYIELLPYTIRSGNTTTNVPPNISVEKVVSDDDETRVENNDARPDQEITYDITVRNTGGNATGVTLVDDYEENYINILDADGGNDNGDTITWDIGDLRNQEERTFTIQAQVTAPLDHGTYQAPNTVTVDSNETPPTDDSTQTNITAEVIMNIDKTVSDTDETNVGANHIQGAHPDSAERTITYRIEIENTGDADATGVRIVDDISEVLTYGRIQNISNNGQASSSIDGSGNISGQIIWNIGDLAQGESRVVTFDAYFNQGILDETQIENIATVETNEVPDLSDTTETTVHAPILQITKDDGIEQGEPSQTVRWVLNVRNIGTGNAYNVEVYDIVPERMTVLAGSISDDGAYSSNTREIRWATTEPQYILNGLHNPDPRSTWGESKTLSFDVVLDDIFPVGTTNLNNRAVIETDNYPSDETEHNLPVEAYPENDIEKYVLNETARDQGRSQSGTELDHPEYGADADTLFSNTDDVFAIAGDTLKYTLVYRNTGNAHSPDTYVRDHLPRYITDSNGNRFEIILPTDIFDISDDVSVLESASGYDIIWEIGELEVGEEWQIKEFRVTLNSDSAIDLSSDHLQRLIDNVSEITSDHPEVEADTDNAIIQVNQPRTTIEKGADKLEYQSDEQITYTITVENVGSSIAFGTVSDILPDGLSFVSTDFEGNYTVDGQNISFDVELESGDSIEITIVASFDIPVTDLETFNNEVNITYTDANDNERPEQTDDIEVEVHAPILELEKVQDLPEIVAPGQPIVYTLNYSNIGTGYASNVSIIDTIPEHTTFVEFIDTPEGIEAEFNQEENTVQWNLGNLDPDETGSVSFRVVINIPTETGTEIRNTAVIYTPVLDEVSSEVTTATTSSCCLNGQVWDDANKNGVFDFDENPVEGAKVTIRWNESEYLPESEDIVFSDANGNYNKLGLPYYTPITINVDLPDGFDEVTTTREFQVVLLPPREDGVKEDYIKDGIRHVTADECMNFLNVGMFRDIVIAETGDSIIPGLVIGIGLIGVGITGSTLLITKRFKRKK